MCACEFTVCATKGGGDKERSGYKREGGDEGMVRKRDERWQAIKRPINLLNECPSSRGYRSLLHVHQSQGEHLSPSISNTSIEQMLSMGQTAN